MNDVAPELLEAIQKEFTENMAKNSNILRIQKLINAGKATYVDGNEYAAEVGQILANAFKNNLSSAVLPDGRMYFNIADRILNTTLGENHDLISAAAMEIQTSLNKAAGIGLKAVKAPVDKEKIKGFIDRISSEPEYDKISWILDQPVVNYSQTVMDNTIKANADRHFRAGLTPVIVRTPSGEACKWCMEVAGTYAYPGVPQDVFRRHDNCYCSVDYVPGDGRSQNVHSKRWR